jgi:AraC family transcriptional regulator
MNTAVERAIKCVWERYSEPLSLADIARSAALSRFHFSRVFKDVTGVSPGQYLSAVRIYQAKRMLLTTSMNVADISAAVGYTSPGSFANHFTDSVGLSPGQFRRMSERGGVEPVVSLCDPSSPEGEVAGTVSLPEGYAAAFVYIGVFDTQIVQHRPRAATRIEIPSSQPFPYRLAEVPAGRWFVHAVALADSFEPEPWNQRSLLVGGLGPVRISPGARTLAALALRPRHPADLPILLALPDLDTDRERLVRPHLGSDQRIQGIGR